MQRSAANQHLGDCEGFCCLSHTRAGKGGTELQDVKKNEDAAACWSLSKI